jgi:hypothetical protein
MEDFMTQDMMEDACSRDIAGLKDSTPDHPRPLTHDERKAAEAAFRGDPFNPAWSGAAAKVYAGIVSAMEKMQEGRLTDSDVNTEWMAVR